MSNAFQFANYENSGSYVIRSPIYLCYGIMYFSRAKAERESRKKAMLERAKKGVRMEFK